MAAPVSPPAGSAPVPRWLLLGFLAAALLASGWALTRHWNDSLRDAHEFRQMQTALSAYYFKHEGLRLDYETPVLGPPWSIPMEFPLYQGVVAVFSNFTGVPLAQSGRFVSVFFFYASLPAVWLLLRRRLPGATDPALAVAAILVGPLYLFYSRAFMIESTALCLSVWFLQLLDCAFERRRALPAVWLVGALAAVTKITTFGAFWIAGLLLLLERIAARRRAGQAWGPAIIRPSALALAAIVVPLLAGVAWVAYSDHVKALNPYGSLITSGALRPFNLGTLAQRATFEWWRGVGYITFHEVLVWPALVVLGLGLVFSPSAYRRVALACLLCFPGGCLLFANLYYVHDYYSYASGIFPLAALGIAGAGLLRSPRLPRFVGAMLLAAALACEVTAFVQTYHKSFYRQPSPPPPPAAEIIRLITPPADVFAGLGLDWSSVWPYYAERRAIMPFLSHVQDFATFERSLAGLGSRRVAALAVAPPYRDDQHFTNALIARLQLGAKPIARTAEMDIYVRKDLAAAAVSALAARSDWAAEINLVPDPVVPRLTEQHDFSGHDWTHDSPASPAPLWSRGPFPVNFFGVDGQPVFGTQAPTEIYFQPPPGSHSLEAVTGMMPSSYSGPNRTPGVTLQVFEEAADGTRRILFERLLTPLTQPGDRGDVTISYSQATPFTGRLVFAHYTVPSGDISYAWGYWKRISIR